MATVSEPITLIEIVHAAGLFRDTFVEETL